MNKYLVIVESPAKTKKIQQFLGKEYNVVASNGCVVDLDPKQLSIDTESMTPKFSIMKSKNNRDEIRTFFNGEGVDFQTAMFHFTVNRCIFDGTAMLLKKHIFYAQFGVEITWEFSNPSMYILFSCRFKI